MRQRLTPGCLAFALMACLMFTVVIANHATSTYADETTSKQQHLNTTAKPQQITVPQQVITTRENPTIKPTTISDAAVPITSEPATSIETTNGVTLLLAITTSKTSPTSTSNTTEDSNVSTYPDQENTATTETFIDVTDNSENAKTSFDAGSTMAYSDQNVTTMAPATTVNLYPCGAITFKQKFNTSCDLCHVTHVFGHPPGTKFLREVQCHYSGHYCLIEYETEVSFGECCPGRWGPDCQLCPGATSEPDNDSAAINPCFKHGNCYDGFSGNGTCNCEVGFSGSACESCARSYVYGTNCNNTCECIHGICDSGITGTGACYCEVGYQGLLCDERALCNASLCGENAQCKSKRGQCECIHGYRGDGIKCTFIDMCAPKWNSCDPHANCTMLGPANHSCNCHGGYKGDGINCSPIDPCQDLINAACVTNSSNCNYIGPGKHKCICKAGFANFTEGTGCAVRNLCAEDKTLCHKQAKCTMLKPNNYKCTCVSGFVGNGQICYGNILQTLQELNRQPPYQSQLTNTILLFKFALGDALQNCEYFTAFVPLDSGLRKVNLNTLMSDWSAAVHFVKNHILPIAQTRNELVTGGRYYTLEGTSANITFISRWNTVRYQLSRRARAIIVKANFVSTNGIIHLINKPVDKAPVIGHKKRQSLLSQIHLDGRFNRIQNLIGVSGLNDLLNSTSQNLTVFTPNNKAWDAFLNDQTYSFLQAPEGKAKLITLIKNHILVGNVFSFDLMKGMPLRTLANNVITVQVSAKGKLLIGHEDRYITQSDIPAANGIYHHVTGVLVPESILPLIPKRCDITQQRVTAICKVCGAPGPTCPSNAIQLSSSTQPDCHLSLTSTFITRHSNFTGCTLRCNYTDTVQSKCCENFFGPECDPCPGGYPQPCGGRGQCNDGIHGNGRCDCQRNFTGTICDWCTNTNKTGLACEKDCTCLYGECNNKVKGGGKCKFGTCLTAYKGKNCHQHKERCGNSRHRVCHAHAYCEVDITNHTYTRPWNIYTLYMQHRHRRSRIVDEPIERNFRQINRKCHCLDGYEGDGVSCEPVNPCQLPDRAGCHIDAACEYVSPGKGICTCNSGWVGDGFYCTPTSPCVHDQHCHHDAICERASPGESWCVCKARFHGNGTLCIPINVCDFNNGGCSPLASCIPLEPGRRNCTCASGYGGDGVTCFGTVMQQLLMIEDLQEFVTHLVLSGQYSILTKMENQITVFVPNNSVFFDTQSKQNLCPMDDFNTMLYYILPVRYTINQLDTLTHAGSTSNSQFLPTLFTVKNKTQEVKIKNDGELKINTAHVLQGDIVALNGIIHIIDGCLYPPRPFANLSTLLNANSRFSNFTHALKVTRLLSYLEQLHTSEFTLFVLDNVHWKQMYSGSDLRNYISYYIAIDAISLDSLPVSSQIRTLLGNGPSSVLNITTQNRRIHVNGFVVNDDRLRTSNVNVYRISHPLSPNLHRCDKAHDDRNYRRECCLGYFGYDCSACPGSATTPCNQHGTCHQGLSGSGLCTCNEGYMGDSCQICSHGYMAKGTKCYLDPCFLCDRNAECVQLGNQTSCRCASSYRGNGTHCVHLCSLNNGGCHKQAKCTAQNNRVTCKCPKGFYGDGRLDCTCIVSLLESVKTLMETSDFYKLLLLGDNNEERNYTVLDLIEKNENITLIIPVNWAMNDSFNNTDVDAKRHVVAKYFELSPTMFVLNKTEYTTISGASLTVDYIQKDKTYLINSSRVLRRNIPAQNGIIHIIDHPLHPPPITLKQFSGIDHNNSNLVLIGSSLGSFLIVVIIVIGVSVLLKRSQCLQKVTHEGRFKFSTFDNNIEVYKETPNIIDAALTYENPLYETFQDLDQSAESRC